MHVSQMLKCFMGSVDTIPPTSNQDFEVIKEMLHDMSVRMHTVSNESEFTTSLDGKQAEYIMDSVFVLKDDYFDEIPLADEFKKQFVWNIPSSIYKYLRDVIDMDMGDVMNPMLLFYIFLTENPAMAYGKYLQILRKILNENQSIIDRYASDYDAYRIANEEEGE